METLNTARQNFTEGHLYGIPALLKPCLDNGFNKTEKIQAYWLLARTYLFIDDPISAEDSYLKLLKLDPEYTVDPENDPVEMIYLSQKFKTTPVFVLFGKIGINASKASPFQNFGVDNTSASNEAYSYKFGFHIGVGTEWNMSNHFSLGVEFDLVSRKYAYSNTLFEFDEQTFEEVQRTINIPVFVKYRTTWGKMYPFVYLGINPNRLLEASADVNLIDKATSDDESLLEFPVTGPREDLLDQRKKITASLIAGIGINYRFGYNYIFVDLRYEYGMTNMIDINNQYGNDVLLYRYAIVDDDKRLNSFALSFGYVKPLYKPRKISEKRGLNLKRLFK
ncbi:PorT family protein [Fulvivirga sp. M361]|uniref:porin family protein n=1 Tax=Fulvivirga sp. M361 TaxID=2594266 RepID=UPI00117B7CF4|nr:porin family protein [Fulvivirga sp. M361]TRX48140.1 PorT family protein [Fulvivirga sp. M361]